MDFLNDLDTVSPELEYKKEDEKQPEEQKSSQIPINPNFPPLPSNLRPIPLVDYIEKNYPSIISSTSNISFKISEYKSQSSLKLSILQFPKYPLLNTEIFKEQTAYTAMTIHKNHLFLGDENGIIFLFDTNKSQKLQTFQIDSLPIKTNVSSIDISNNGKFLISGYSNGVFALWDIERKNKPIYYNIEIHKKEILAIRFFSCNIEEEGLYKILTSDKSCQVHKIQIKRNFLGYHYVKEDNTLCKEVAPIFLIEVIRPRNNKEITIVALATIEKMIIFSFYQGRQNKIFTFETMIENTKFVPDVAFGYGCEPKEDNTGFLRKDDDEESEMHKEEVLMMAISCDKLIKLFKVNVLREKATIQKIPIGHFVNQYQVIRIGFIANSTIFFFDTQKQIKVVNTQLIKDGDYKEKDKKNYTLQIKALLEEGRVIDPDILAVNVSLRIDTKNFSYRNFVIGMKNKVILICLKAFHMGELLNYENYIKELVEEENWMEAMGFGLDLYKGNLSSFPGLPTNIEDRKKALTESLKNLIFDYINANTKKDMTTTTFSKKVNFQKLKDCMDTVIEFCIGFKAVDFLFNEVLLAFDGYSDDFIERVEPFIFSNLLKNDAVTTSTLSSLIMTYGTQDNYSLLSHLLTHLNFDSLNNILIESSCDKYNLLTTMIYVDCNHSDAEVNFKPIERMFSLFTDNKTLHLKENYNEIYNREGIKIMEKTKNYIGHKLLWYIDMCLNGKKLNFSICDNESFDVNSRNYKTLIGMIYVWLISENIFNIFLLFDSYSLFSVLEKFFTISYLDNIIEEFDFDSNLPEKFIKKYNIDKKKNYHNIKEIIDLICVTTRKNSTFLILQDMNMFIIKVASTKIDKLTNDVVMQTTKEILTFYSNTKGVIHKDANDPFNCHQFTGIDTHISNNTKDNDYINEISTNLHSLFSSGFPFLENELRSLISICEAPFISVQIKIYELMKDYIQCIEVYLTHLKELELKSLLLWIENKIENLSKSKDNKVDYFAFQDAIILKMDKLLSLAPDDLMDIINKNFSIDKKFDIATKLENSPEMELNYINKLIKEIEVIKEKENEKENSVIAAPKSSIEENELPLTLQELDCKLEELLMIEFNLLVKIKKNDDILKNFQKRKFSYPIEKCIDICKKNKIIESCVYLYQLNGETKAAFNVANDETKRIFYEIMKLNSNASKFQNKKDEFKKSFYLSIKICEKNSEQLDDKQERNNDNNLWVDLLKEIYLLFNKATVANNTPVVNFLSKEIDAMLKKMCLYVNIKIILDIVTSEYQNAEYKEFRGLLTKMLASNTRLTNILQSARTLLCNSVLYNVIDLKKESGKGNVYSLKTCDVCYKRISHSMEDYFDYIVAFQCGHLVHERCTEKGLDGFTLKCIACKQNEIEEEKELKGGKSFWVERENKHSQKIIRKINNYEGGVKEKIVKLKDFDRGFCQLMEMY